MRSGAIQAAFTMMTADGHRLARKRRCC